MGIRRRSTFVNYSLSFYLVTTSILATWKRWIFSVPTNIRRNRLCVFESSPDLISTISIGLSLYFGDHEFQLGNETINYSEHTQWPPESQSHLHQSSSAMCGEHWRKRNGCCFYHWYSSPTDLRVGERRVNRRSPALCVFQGYVGLGETISCALLTETPSDKFRLVTIKHGMDCENYSSTERSALGRKNCSSAAQSLSSPLPLGCCNGSCQFDRCACQTKSRRIQRMRHLSRLTVEQSTYPLRSCQRRQLDASVDCHVIVHRLSRLHLLLRPGPLAVCEAPTCLTELSAAR